MAVDNPIPDYRALEPLTECEVIALGMFLDEGDVRTDEQRTFLAEAKRKIIDCAAKAIAAL